MLSFYRGMCTKFPAIGAHSPADEVNAIVLDLGSYQVKAGYAGEDTPKYIFPSVRQRLKMV